MFVNNELYRQLHVRRKIIMRMGKGFDFEICEGVILRSWDYMYKNDAVTVKMDAKILSTQYMVLL